MTAKLIGAVLVIAGCGGFGFSVAASHIREEQCLKKLIQALEYMKCELTYRHTPLPELCRLGSKASGGIVGDALSRVADELEAQTSPDAAECLSSALSKIPPLPKKTETVFSALGSTLGLFDLEGQILGLESVLVKCKKILEGLEKDREQRLRSYQTLGLCAGAAIVILFI